MRIIKTYPPEVTRVLFELGDRKLVWVEGTDDEETFREWFLEQRGQVEFYTAGGWKNVANQLQEYEQYLYDVYGIVDRDFRSQTEIEAALHNPAAHLFILPRYAIENYLLEPGALCEELRVYYGSAYPAPNPVDLETNMLLLSQKLSTLMAANWVLFEIESTSGIRLNHFSPAHQLDTRQAITEQAAQRANWEITKMELRIIEKENLIEPLLHTLTEAHTCINGKHLLHQIYQKYIVAIKRGLDKAHLRRLLARTVKRQGLPTDIVTIVEHRILQYSDTTGTSYL